MNFRTKLLLLLLTITLLPLGLSFLAQRNLVTYYGNKLADDTHTLINDNAVNLLHVLVDDYGRILSRDHAMARFTLQAQAQAVRQAFIAPQPRLHAPVYLAEDFDHPSRQPADLSPSPLHLRRAPDGSLKPMAVSWDHQVFYLVAGTDPAKVADQLQRMADMTRIYRSLQQIEPDLFLWQYTALTSGVHSSYPGKGGYPADYDPRRRQWYQQAVINGGTIQQVLTDVTTGSLILTLAQPVYDDKDELLGVTALDIDYRKLFTDWNIPPQWHGVTRSMIMRFDSDESDPTRQLEILLTNRDNGVVRDWSLPLTPEFIDLSDPQLEPVAQDLQQGRSAVRKVEYAGEEMLFAYGVNSDDSPFPLVMVPYDQVIAPAARARQAVNRQITLGLSFSALLTLVAVLAAVLLALRHARRVTDPITQLATAAQQLTQGQFDTRVDIRTNDELQNLGEIFNGLGSRLKERDKLKQSLELAKEIQQQLLPRTTPRYSNFELIGVSRYCDETGGDYYDFIPLQEAENKSLGVVVGDVSGHGIGSALVMASVRGALHTLINYYSDDLPGMAAEINRQLCRSTDDSSFMTLFFGALDPEQRTLNWVSAGQAPVFLYRAQPAGGEIEELQSSGIPLGIIAASDYAMEPAIHLNPGDMLLIGTDGIWETHNFAGEIFGTRRLCDILRQSADLSVDKIADRIFVELDQFRGDRTVDDDRTLVLIKAIDATNANKTPDRVKSP
jgi:sigma-B regulation protein RsbU (phosphoserine phosphatase)